jgi:hypothetical protein
MGRCDPGLVGVHPGEVDVNSPQFTQSNGAAFDGVSSEVSIERSRTSVEDDFAKLRSTRLLDCLVSAIKRATVPVGGGQTTRLTDVHASDVAFSIPRSDAEFDIRIQFAFTAAPVPFYLDVRGMALGHDELALTTISTFQPFQPTRALQLATLMLNRALARPH